MARKDRTGQNRNIGNPLADASPGSGPSTTADQGSSSLRVIYVDVDDDLPEVLDRVEESPDPAILVLPDGAHAIRGMVSARLLARRSAAADIQIAAVAADRALIAQLEGAGIECAATVGEARALFADIAVTRSTPAPLLVSRPDSGVDAALLEVDDELVEKIADSTSLAPVGTATAVTLDDHAGPDDDGVAIGRPSPGHSAPRGRRRVRGWGLLVVLVALLFAIVAVAWVVLFPAATVSINYGSQVFDRTYVIGFGSNVANQVPLRHTHSIKSLTVSVLGTGATEVADGHASGIVTFANQLNGVVIVPVGTIVNTAGGARYATDVSVSVPGALHSFAGTSNGQASVRIHAINAGDGSNALPGSVTSIEGRLAGALLITNYQPLTGGTMRTVYTLTPADLKSPVAQLRRTLQSSAVAALNRTYAKSPFRWITKEQEQPLVVRKYTIKGRPAAHITMTLRTDMSYVHMSDVVALAMRLNHQDIADRNQVVMPGTVSLRVSADNSQSLRGLDARVTARTSPAIDVANMRALLTGMSIADARRLLDGSAKNGGWSYSLSVHPDWAKRLPIAESLIVINVHKES